MKHQAVHLEEVLTLCDSGEWGDDPVNGEGVPVLRVSDVKASNHISFSTAPIRFLSAQKRASKTLKNGDIVVVKSSGSATNVVSGRASLVSGVDDNQYGFANFLLRLRVDERRYNPHFLIHILGSQQVRDYVLSMVSGSTYPNLRVPEYKRILIPNPPLAEQQRIVGLLDEAFEGLATAKANAEKNLQNARALFESHLQSVFTQRGPGWVETTLGDLCDFLNGFAFKSGDVVAESQTQLVRMGNLYGNQLDLDRNPVFYPDSFATEHSHYVLEEGDIIMSLTGTTGKEDYGFAVRIPDCGHTLLMNQRIMKFDALKRDIIDDGYLLHYLRSRCFLNILYPTANGTRQANLSSVTMKLLPVPLRSLKEQKAIATKLDDLREETQRLARLYERKLAALEALKKSLLHQAFTGQL
jgi:type I restriction enzyme S subunit